MLKCFYCMCLSSRRCHRSRWGHEGSQPSGWTSFEEEEAETRKRRPVRYKPLSRKLSQHTDRRLLRSLPSPVSLCFFSLSVSPAAVCEADEVSPPTGILLIAAAAGSLHWYDSGILLYPTAGLRSTCSTSGLT